MARPKAPRWLTQSFADGVDERQPARPPKPAFPGANPYCVLAALDPRRRPCSGKLERFHWISRQRVENAFGALLPSIEEAQGEMVDQYLDGDETLWHYAPADLILLAAWDPRNADLGCEGHHRRYDSHLTPALPVPREKVPPRVVEFAHEYGIERLLDRFDSEI